MKLIVIYSFLCNSHSSNIKYINITNIEPHICEKEELNSTVTIHWKRQLRLQDEHAQKIRMLVLPER